jgi:3-phytase
MRAPFPGCLLLLAASAFADVKIEAVPGQPDFKFNCDQATDFSGITWTRDDTYYVVSNRAQALFPLRIEVQPSGAIASARVGAKIPVTTRLDDFEGIAYWPDRDRLYVSTERPPGIVGFNRMGDATFQVTVPPVFAKARRNKGLESLAYGAGAFWTGNEDTLQGDGNPSSAREGAVARLQKFDERFRPVAQFAYQTDTSLMRASDSGTGLTDLLVLPDGTLLALERVVGLGLLAKIYRIEFEGATDISALRSLAGAEFTPVKKRLLYERHTGGRNFEGLALGPELADGWRSLILIADSGGKSEHILMPLRLRNEPNQ